MTWLLSLLPAPWLAALKAVPWRLVGFIAAAIVAAWLWILVGHWHEDSLTLPKVRAQAALDAKQAAVTLDSWKKAYASAQAASEGYAHELQTIHAAPTPTGVIRVCKPARMPAAGTGAVASQPGGTSAPAAVVHKADALPVGPLYDLARRCDELSAQVRGLEAFIETR